MIVHSLWKGAIENRVSMPTIAAEIADQYGVTVADLRGASRKKLYAEPRRHAIWLMSQQAHLSLPMIGRYMGSRDHTTILHHRDRFQALLDAEALEVAA
jgi:chromosomal replication initiator protein